MTSAAQPSPAVLAPGQCPPVPASAMTIGALGVLGEVAQIADAGDAGPLDGALPVSMALTALAVVWFARGVLAGRTVRTGVVLAIVGLSVLADLVDLVAGLPTDLWPLVHLALSAAMLTALLVLIWSPYYAWQRHHHDLSRVQLGPVLALALLAGLLGPVAPAPGSDDGSPPGLHVDIRL